LISHTAEYEDLLVDGEKNVIVFAADECKNKLQIA
jgi:hypothetical protein